MLQRLASDGCAAKLPLVVTAELKLLAAGEGGMQALLFLTLFRRALN
jgi:hypothetical protein